MSTQTETPNDETHIDVKAVNSGAYRKLYKKREQIYPKLAHGGFRRFKWVSMAILLAIYYITPWIRWDRGVGRPDQATLIDFEHGRFYFFFIELWPQEVYFFAGLLIFAALGMFLATALFGRVWCGYACPQTVWTDLYLHVERWIEGDRNDRIKLDKAPLSISKASKKIAKHVIWLAVAAATGGAWVFYFTDAPTLLHDLFAGSASRQAYIFIGILTFTTYALAGTMREQVCTYLCPWPRIQAAMIDRHALSVTYRADRGEPRGPHKKGASWEGRGDCVDCNQCVAVCPQGIDIRDGDQLECINCALCIDACNAVMDKVGRPRGLIAYDTHVKVEAREAAKAQGQTCSIDSQKSRFVRPRTIVYAAAMFAVGALILYGLVTRASMQIDVIRDRAPPFVRMTDGSIRNDYALKIVNRAAEPRNLVVTVSGLEGIKFSRENAAPAPNGMVIIQARGDGVTDIRAHILAPPGVAPGVHPLEFDVLDPISKEHTKSASAFLAGEP